MKDDKASTMEDAWHDQDKVALMGAMHIEMKNLQFMNCCQVILKTKKAEMFHAKFVLNLKQNDREPTNRQKADLSVNF